MTRAFHLSVTSGLAIVALVLLAGSPAVAQTPGPPPCGRVTAYTMPTANTAGAITFGTTTFRLAAGSAPETAIATGQDVCINGERDATGTFTRFTVTPMAQGICGMVTAFVPATAASPGSMTLSSVQGSVTVRVRPGVTLSPEQATGGHCFTTGVNAEGNPEIVGYISQWNAPRQLPSTTTSSAGGRMVLAVGLLAGTAAFAVAGRRLRP